jgi:hypothetical protein
MLVGDPRATGMRRRDFVALGSAALASSFLLDGNASAGQAAGLPLPAAAPSSLPIGYWVGSEHLPTLDLFGDALAASWPGLSSDIVPATSLPAGDARLLGSRVALTVLGVFWQVRSLSFRVVFSGEQPVEYPAWNFAWRGGAPNPSPSVRLHVPVSSEDGLTFAGEFKRPDAGVWGGRPRPFRTQLSLGHGTDRPKLRRGIYVAALPGRLLPGPVWRRYEMALAGASDSGPRIQLRRRGAPDEPRRDLGYLLLLVDVVGGRLRPRPETEA